MRKQWRIEEKIALTENVRFIRLVYEGLQIDGFLNILLEAGIERVIDVRHNPSIASLWFS